MAPLVLTAAEQEAALKLGSTELKALLAREGISLRVQALFFHSNVVTLAGFSNFAKDEEDLRDCIKDEFGLDAKTSLQIRSEVGGVISAYQSATTRRTEISKLNGELDARQIQKPMLGSQYLVLKTAFEQLHGEQEDADLPAKTYLEKRLADLESGELRAEPLCSVISRDMDEEEALVPHWDSSGQVRFKKAILEAAEPANPEELRSRLNVMLNGLMMLALQHSNRSEIQGFTPSFVHSYTKYLLGEHCWGLVAKDDSGNTIAAPHWGLVLKYEAAIRKRAYKIMTDTGRPLHLCIREAWMDPLVKERSFTTPLALSTVSKRQVSEVTQMTRQASSGSAVFNAMLKPKDSKAAEGKGKAKGGKGKKGKKGGKAKKGERMTVPAGCAARTPDGRSLCYGYNDAQIRCRKSDCTFAHVCGRCFEKHPIYACSGNRNMPPIPSPGETQGSG